MDINPATRLICQPARRILLSARHKPILEFGVVVNATGHIVDHGLKLISEMIVI